MDSKRGFAEPPQIAPRVALSPVAARSAAPRDLPELRAACDLPVAETRAPRIDATWLASSFDLAQGLEVKVMESKLSRETLDSLFRA